MVFFTRAIGDADAVHSARAGYVVWFEEKDHALLLKQAQPELQWHKPLPAAPDAEGLAYGDFAEIVLVGANNGDDDKTAYPLMKYILDEVPLTRVWGEIQVGLGADGFTPCAKGIFYGRIRAAKAAASVDKLKLDIAAADLKEVPGLKDAPAWFKLISWDSTSFPMGLELIGNMECYAETRMGSANIHGTESALAAYLQLSGGAAKRVAMHGWGSMRASSQGTLVVKHWHEAVWPVCLERWLRHGTEREIDAIERSGYYEAGGVGVVAERAVLARIGTLVLVPPYLPVGVLLDVTPPATVHQKVSALRRAFEVFRIEGGTYVTLGPLERLAYALAQRSGHLNSAAIRMLTIANRVESFVGTGDLPSTVVGASGASGVGGTADQKGSGRSRFDSGKTAELRASAEYIEQKRAGLALVTGGDYFGALRVFLAGRLPVTPPVMGGAAPPEPEAAPLLVFHVVLFDEKVEPWQIDPELQPLAALRAHIPAYLGNVATGTMHGGPWVCQLRALAKAWLEPDKWAAKDSSSAGTPPAIENDVWRVVLASKHGEEGLAQGAIPEVSKADAYTQPYLMYATRSFVIKVLQALGVSVVGSTVDTQPTSVADVWDEAIDRMDGHGVLAVLRSGVLASVHDLIVGCFGELGLRLAAARRSRDLTMALPTAFVLYPSQSVVDWNLKAVLYEGAARRRREDSLVVSHPGGHTAVPLATLGGTGSDAASLLSSRATESVSAELAELRALSADFKKVLLNKGKTPGGGVAKDPKGKEPLPALKLSGGSWLRSGQPARWSKEKFDAMLVDIDVDPATICQPHFITRAVGGTAAECKRDCTDADAHFADGCDMHRFLAKMKVSAARTDSVYEESMAKRREVKAAAAGSKRSRP
jgi:hypothetical protein